MKVRITRSRRWEVDVPYPDGTVRKEVVSPQLVKVLHEENADRYAAGLAAKLQMAVSTLGAIAAMQPRAAEYSAARLAREVLDSLGRYASDPSESAAGRKLSDTKSTDNARRCQGPE